MLRTKADSSSVGHHIGECGGTLWRTHSCVPRSHSCERLVFIRQHVSARDARVRAPRGSDQSYGRITGCVVFLFACWLGIAAETFPELSKQAASARERNQIDQAIKLYRECVRLRPSWAEGWWYLGTLLYDKDAFADAGQALARFVKIDANAAPGYALLGLSEYETKKYSDALPHLEKALSLGLKGDPQVSKVTRFHAGLLLTYFGQFESALQRYAQLAVQSGGDPDMTVAVGLAAMRMPLLPRDLPASQQEIVIAAGTAVQDSLSRRPADAQRAFESLVAKYPNTPQVHNIYGAFLLASDPDAAIREWRLELEISPKHVPARLQLAFEYVKRGEPASGLAYAREAVELAPDLFVAHNALGQALVGSGKLSEGIAELEKARDLAPDSPETRVVLASAYAKAGRDQDAKRERTEFLRLRKLRGDVE